MNTWDIVQIFLILGVMMGVMYALLYLVKKYLYSFEKKGNSDVKINVISTQAILPKRFVSVIEFNNSLYLLGVSDQSINLIDKYETDEITNNGVEKVLTEKPNFLKLLKKNMGIK